MGFVVLLVWLGYYWGMRFFNTAGPVDCDRHYCLPPLARFDLSYILMLIAQQKYFVLHAPRQVGKTSFLLALMQHLNQGDTYHALYINVEVAQTAREDVARGMEAILTQISNMARYYLQDERPSQLWQGRVESGPDVALNTLLSQWTQQLAKPLVLLIDEIDALVGDTLISVLRQLRAGYTLRPQAFPLSVILCGVRDVRDYRIYSHEGREVVTGGSAFNIKAESLRLHDFSRAEMESLYQQHNNETGQLFTPEAVALLWQYSQGQPWLVNALADEITFKSEIGRVRTTPITPALVIAATEALIQRRETHLDQLVDKLHEARVQRIIGPMLLGGDFDKDTQPDDLQYVIDLGLVKRGVQGLQIANPIYREIIPRALNHIVQSNLESHQQTAWYVGEDGRLDTHKLLAAFQQFFRENAEHWVERFAYKEAGPQLLMQAFLQRIANGGGRVEREYGLGRQRTDLLLIWPIVGETTPQKVVIELKLLRQSQAQTMAAGLAQTGTYMDKVGVAEGHLVIFDRRPDKSWEERIYQRQESYKEHMITVWGM